MSVALWLYRSFVRSFVRLMRFYVFILNIFFVFLFFFFFGFIFYYYYLMGVCLYCHISSRWQSKQDHLQRKCWRLNVYGALGCSCIISEAAQHFLKAIQSHKMRSINNLLLIRHREDDYDYDSHVESFSLLCMFSLKKTWFWSYPHTHTHTDEGNESMQVCRVDEVLGKSQHFSGSLQTIISF